MEADMLINKYTVDCIRMSRTPILGVLNWNVGLLVEWIGNLKQFQ